MGGLKKKQEVMKVELVKELGIERVEIPVRKDLRLVVVEDPGQLEAVASALVKFERERKYLYHSARY